MEIRWVQNIRWSGTNLNTYILIEGCGLSGMSIVPAPTLFLLSEAQKGSGIDSLRAFAEDLKSFFINLSRLNMDWREVTDGDVTSYIHFQLRSGKNLKDVSIDRHICSLKGFYSFGWACGLLSEPKNYSYYYKKAKVREQGESKLKINLNLKKQYLNQVLFDQVLSGVVAKSNFKRERDELTLFLGGLGGLRTSEVTDERNLVTTDLKLLIEKAAEVGQSTINVKIFGKGNKLRYVDFPPLLTRRIRYFLEGRRNSIKDGPLICSDIGKGLRRSHATDIFRLAKRAVQHRIPSLLGSLSTEVFNQYYVSFDAFKELTFHSLRHTYATNLVDFCYRNGINPFEYVPDQMGHEDEKTTRAYIVFDALIHRREKLRRALENEQST